MTHIGVCVMLAWICTKGAKIAKKSPAPMKRFFCTLAEPKFKGKRKMSEAENARKKAAYGAKKAKELKEKEQKKTQKKEGEKRDNVEEKESILLAAVAVIQGHCAGKKYCNTKKDPCFFLNKKGDKCKLSSLPEFWKCD